MNTPKRVILLYNSLEHFIPFFEKKGIKCYPSYRNLTFFPKIARKIFLLLRLPKSIWFGKWKKKLNEVDTLICFSTNPIESLEYIKKNNPKIRLIYWYWDPAYRNITQPNQISDSLCEKWSFDMDDCKKYCMKYNTTFYLDNIKLPKTKPLYDVIFIGQDKGRQVYLDNLYKQFEFNEIKSFFYIVDDNLSRWNSNIQHPAIPYVKYLEYLSKSIAILDVMQEGQRGLSLRPMESIFFKKKLITNDQSILENDFYDSNNIFILGIDDFSTINNFINTAYKELPNEIIYKYDFTNWLNRFFI